MKEKQKLIIQDCGCDQEIKLRFYLIKGNGFHYFITRYEDQNQEDYSNKYNMYERTDFNDHDYKIAKYVFDAIFSSQYSNTCIDQETIEEDGFTCEELDDFFKKYDFYNLGIIDNYNGPDGFEIYGDFMSCFDLVSCADLLP